jgi:O-methyltransferase
VIFGDAIWNPGQQDVSMSEKAWKALPSDYDADHLAVWAKNLGFMTDTRFLSAYRRGMNSGHKIGQAYGLGDDLDIHWRVHVCCWAATHAKRLPGDFVECGVNTGIYSLAICNYIDLNATGKTFWLFDTYEGIPEHQMLGSERELRLRDNRMYPDCYEIAMANFSAYPRARVVRGVIPDILANAAIDEVAYLSIDLNIAEPERAALEYFWPKLVTGAVIVLDDYAWRGYEEQKTAADGFAKSVGTEILTMPTGQGLLLKS